MTLILQNITLKSQQSVCMIWDFGFGNYADPKFSMCVVYVQENIYFNERD